MRSVTTIMQAVETKVAAMKYPWGTVKSRNMEAATAMRPLTNPGPPSLQGFSPSTNLRRWLRTSPTAKSTENNTEWTKMRMVMFAYSGTGLSSATEAPVVGGSEVPEG